MCTDNLLHCITMQFQTMPEVQKTTNRRKKRNQKKEKKNHYEKLFLKHMSHCVSSWTRQKNGVYSQSLDLLEGFHPFYVSNQYL